MGHPRRKANPQLKARTTRSSRGRLLSLSDPAQTSQRLDDQLRALGLYAAPTLGDGNCLFRALSDQLYGTDSKHAALRQLICDWINTHKARYEPFVEDERGIDTHLRCMRENATYGGHMELSAFAHMAQRNVKVVQPGLVYVIEWQAFAVASSPTPPPAPPLPDMEDLDADADPGDHSTIYVAYHDWEHFSSIRNLKGPHVGLPRVKERPVSQADLPPSPVVEQYKPAKDRKKAGKERDRQRKELKREKARDKAKGKQATLLTESESDADDDDLSEPEVSSEKLKIKLKLTLNSKNSSHSPSSSLSNISEAESSSKAPQQKTGLKLRLPPSRSLSLAPSNVSTPPNSQASSTSTLLNTTTTTSPPPHPTISDIYPSMAEALPHANPPTHTSAPHLISNSRESSPGGGHRTNRSPKRTFEESEIEDLHSVNGRGVRSRLRGPPSHGDGGELEVVESLVDDHDNNEDDEDEDEDNITTATTTTTSTTTASSSSPEASSPPPPPSSKDENQQSSLLSPHTTFPSASSSSPHIHEPSDDTIMTSPTTPTASVPRHLNPDTLPQNSPTKKTPRKQQRQQQQQQRLRADPNPQQSSSSPPSPPSPHMTRQQKKREALNHSLHSTNNHPPQHNGGGMLTRRQRKALGLPRVRRRMVGPYDRVDDGKVGAGGGGGNNDNEEAEWKKNGTGRVDVRGFKELKI